MNRCVVLLVISVFLSSATVAAPQTCSQAPARLDDILGLRTAPGAFVMGIEPGSPAEQLAVCDLIAGFNGEDYRRHGDLAAFVGAFRDAAMFSRADLQVWRSSDSGQTYHQDSVKIQIPPRPGARIGASVTFQVLILAVLKDGWADRAGVQVGEFIEQVNGQKISDLRSIVDLDQQIDISVKQEGKVLLTLARWKPVSDSALYKTTYTTREVQVTFRSLALDAGQF